jgi:hypothetical protein
MNIVDKLLDPASDISTLGEDEMIALMSESISFRENYQKIFGRIASEYTRRNIDRKRVMKNLAAQLEEMTGIKVAENSLYVYRYVWDRVGALGVPQDFAYRTWRLLAESDNPKGWLNKAKTKGWSGPYLARRILKKRGINKRIVTCPHCKETFEL